MNWLKNKWLAFIKNDEIELLKQEVGNLKVLLQASQTANRVAYTELSQLVANSRTFATGGFLGRRALGRLGEQVSERVRKHDPAMDHLMAQTLHKGDANVTCNMPSVDPVTVTFADIRDALGHVRRPDYDHLVEFRHRYLGEPYAGSCYKLPPLEAPPREGATGFRDPQPPSRPAVKE